MVAEDIVTLRCGILVHRIFCLYHTDENVAPVARRANHVNVSVTTQLYRGVFFGFFIPGIDFL